MTSRSMLRLLALLLSLAVVAAACGDSDDDGESEADATTSTPAETTEAPAETDATEAPEADDGFPVTITDDDGEVAIDARPEAIVSLSPTSTEMLFAIGAGPQVVAVDSFSNFPAEAPITDLSGFQPNVEAIVAFEPDLVVMSGADPDTLAGLDAVGIPVIIHGAAATLDDTYRQIEQLGAATGQLDLAVTLVAQMQTDIDELASQAPADAGLTYFHELDDTLFSVTSSTFIGEVYSLAGLSNVADAADPDGAAGGFPQLDAEFLIDADPDLIFLADTKCCGQNAETVSGRPGWDVLTAVQNGAIIELDDDIASRWGPRVVDFLRIVIDATASVTATAG
ncbi:MAG: ABC transporter substrate-binding protein [Actinomycetota bacterium]